MLAVRSEPGRGEDLEVDSSASSNVPERVEGLKMDYFFKIYENTRLRFLERIRTILRTTGPRISLKKIRTLNIDNCQIRTNTLNLAMIKNNLGKNEPHF